MKIIDRSSWPPGPWDDEPDEVVWLTRAGFRARAFRLTAYKPACGKWGYELIAHHPTGFDMSRYLRGVGIIFSEITKNRSDKYPFGSVAKTSIDGVGKFGVSFERYDGPVKDEERAKMFGPYVTLEKLKEHAERLAHVLSLPWEEVMKKADF